MEARHHTFSFDFFKETINMQFFITTNSNYVTQEGNFKWSLKNMKNLEKQKKKKESWQEKQNTKQKQNKTEKNP